MKYRITYTSRTFIDRYTCVDTEKTIIVGNPWIVPGTSLVYGYTNQFNVVSIPFDMIIDFVAILE